MEREQSASRRLIRSVSFANTLCCGMLHCGLVATKFLVPHYATLCHAMIRCNTLYYVMNCVMLRCFTLYDVVLHFCYVVLRFGTLWMLYMIRSVASMDCNNYNSPGRGSSMRDAF